MGYKKSFGKILKEHYPKKFRRLLSEIDMSFDSLSKDIAFASDSQNPLDKRMGLCAYFLAMIKVLEKQGIPFDGIRKICLNVAYEYVRPKNFFQKWAKQLPVKFINTRAGNRFLKVLNRKISAKGHPNGFRATIITDRKETFNLGYGIDILECGICKLYAKNKADHYAPILCEVDKVTSKLAGLVLVRSGTLANGADKCDFRFKLK